MTRVGGIAVSGPVTAARAAKQALLKADVNRLRSMRYFGEFENGEEVPVRIERLAQVVADNACGCAVGMFVFAAPAKKREKIARQYFNRESRGVFPQSVMSFLRELDSAFEDNVFVRNGKADDPDLARKRMINGRDAAIRYCNRVIASGRAAV